MKQTRLTKLLGIQHPIIQAGMAWVSNAELAAAVSNAGGLGLVTPDAGMESGGDIADNFYTQLRKVRALTSKPCGANISLDLPDVESLVNVAIEQAVPVVVTSGGSPDNHTGRLKDAGVLVLHVIASVRHARSAEARGADVVIAEGFEAGSNISRDQLPTLALVPQVVDAVEIPVVAAGGIVDGRGLAAALSLGASGVQVGTRFLVTSECIAHPSVKEAVIKAIDTSTTIVDRAPHHARLLKNRMTASLAALQAKGGSEKEINALLSDERFRDALLEGNVEEGKTWCSAAAGLIIEIMDAGDVVKKMVSEADSVLSKLK
ncbi:MAG: DUF561 domain-containing protein [Dehalococcoidia bacterium]